jgi:hypothetical protein
VEELLRPSLSNLRFYAFALLALVGLVPLLLYVRGAAILAAAWSTDRDWSASVLLPAASVAAFFLFVYDWADKRFLLYVFPALVVCLAAGLEWLRARASRRLPTAVLGCAYLAAAVLWNQIRYPSYGIHYLALTPRDFLEASLTMTSSFKAQLHLAGGHVVRIHRSWLGAFSRGLFDLRLAPTRCATDEEAYTCLATLRTKVDALLKPDDPIGLDLAAGSSGDYYLQKSRFGNAFGRTAGLPRNAAVALVRRGSAGYGPPLEACGPYALVRSH